MKKGQLKFNLYGDKILTEFVGFIIGGHNLNIRCADDTVHDRLRRKTTRTTR